MKKYLALIIGSLILGLVFVQPLGVLPGLAPEIVSAAGEGQTPAPERVASIKVSYTLYEWWLIQWSTNQVVCQVWVEHDGLPYGAEVQYFCGDNILNQWLQTKPCALGGPIGAYSQCPGFYFHRVHVTPGERTINVKLAPPTAFVTLSGCDITATNNQCDTLPSLLITGQEPIPGEEIIRIQGTIDGQAFSCPGASCSLPLPPTGANGVQIEFWVDSSFGELERPLYCPGAGHPMGRFQLT